MSCHVSRFAISSSFKKALPITLIVTWWACKTCARCSGRRSWSCRQKRARAASTTWTRRYARACSKPKCYSTCCSCTQRTSSYQMSASTSTIHDPRPPSSANWPHQLLHFQACPNIRQQQHHHNNFHNETNNNRSSSISSNNNLKRNHNKPRQSSETARIQQAHRSRNGKQLPLLPPLSLSPSRTCKQHCEQQTR